MGEVLDKKHGVFVMERMDEAEGDEVFGKREREREREGKGGFFFLPMCSAAVCIEFDRFFFG